LKKLGIDVQYKYRSGTEEKQGISFSLGQQCFKGSKVDRNFSFGNLEKALRLQQQQLVTQEAGPGPKREARNLLMYQKQRDIAQSLLSKRLLGSNNSLLKKVEKGLEHLLKPEQTDDSIQYQFTQKSEEHKKKKQGHRISR